MSADLLREPWSDTITCHLFGHSYITNEAFSCHGNKLFNFARQEIGKLGRLSSAHSSSIHGGTAEMELCRQNIKKFFSFLNWNVEKCTNAEDVTRLIDWLRSLLLYLGPVSDLERHQIPCGNCENNSCFSVFHLHLEVQSAVLDIFNELEKKSFESVVCHPFIQTIGQEDVGAGASPSMQLIQIMMWELIKLALEKFRSINCAEYFKTSFFPCNHAKEMWKSLCQLLNDKHNLEPRYDSFWMTLRQIHQTLLQPPTQRENEEIDCDKYLLPPEFECKNPTGFWWWMLTHLMAMDSDNQTPPEEKEGIHLLVLTHLKKTLNQSDITEVSLRCYLKCLLKIYENLGQNLNVVIDLWDLYTSKHLNDNCYVATLGMKGMCNTNESLAPGIWVASVRERVTNPVTLKETDTSYELFLRILVQHLHQNKDLSAWKKLKIRIFSKFHKRRMNELTELGLVNFTSLFLTLSMLTEFEDLSGKYVDFCKMLSLEQLKSKKEAVILRGMLAMTIVGQELGCSCLPLLEYIPKLFQHISRLYMETLPDPAKHPHYWQLVTAYFDGVQEVLEACRNRSISRYLILNGLSDILKGALESELRYLLVSLQSIISHISKETTDLMDHNSVQVVGSVLWQEVYPFIKRHATTGTPPEQLADIAATFGHLSLTKTSTAGKEPLSTIFLYFATNENVDAKTSCRFLCHMLPDNNVMDHLTQTLKNLDMTLIQVWLRCCLLLPTDADPQLQALTRIILQKESIKALFSGPQDPEINPLHCVLAFYQSMGQEYMKLEGLLDKMKYREQKSPYFSGVAKIIMSALTGQPSSNTMKKVFCACGYIVKHCPALIYVKSKQDCVLPSLLERLVLPHSVFDAKKPLQPNVKPALWESLPLFIQGLSKLDYRRDAYLQRQMKNIICQYLPRFPLKSSSTSTATTIHPIVSALKPSLARSPNEQASQLQTDVLEIVACNFMTMKGSTTPNTATLGLTFCQDILQRNLSQKQTLRSGAVLLPMFLDCCLLCEDSGLRQQFELLVQVILDAAKPGIEESQRKALSEIILKFFRKQVKLYQQRVFRVLTNLSSSSPGLFEPIIKDMTAEVKAIEFKRGIGTNSQLRQSYIHLLRTLNEQGQAEISQL